MILATLTTMDWIMAIGGGAVVGIITWVKCS